MTNTVAGQLRSLGFGPAQVEAVKATSAEPLTPGKWLTTSDEQRKLIFEQMKRVAARSGTGIEPAESQHVTLWASQTLRAAYLPDVERTEKLFRTKFAEPIRSGLDKRSAHVILLKSRAEYAAWCRAMFDLYPERFEDKDNPGASRHFREEVIKDPGGFCRRDFFAICVGDLPVYYAHHCVVAAVANLYYAQLVNRVRRAGVPQTGFPDGEVTATGVKPLVTYRSPLQTGFINGAETAVLGAPFFSFTGIKYGQESGDPAAGFLLAWPDLVRQRIATNRATPLGKLLQMEPGGMSQANYAEGWTLAGLLSKQPTKFGKLLLELRTSSSELEAIEKIYGWNEKKLTQEWRKYVLAERSKGAEKSH